MSITNANPAQCQFIHPGKFRILAFCTVCLLVIHSSAQIQTNPFHDLKRLSWATDGPRDIEYLDTDADGDLDILLAFSGANYLGHYENLGGGDFYEKDFFNAPNIIQVELNDVNDDGIEDIIYATGVNGSVFWIQRTLSGLGQPSLIDSFWRINHIAASDVDDDGDIDIMVSGRSSITEPLLVMLRQDENGNFIQVPIAMFGQMESPSVMEFLDVDQDGDQDLVCSWHNKLSWLRNNGLGEFTDEVLISEVISSSSGWFEMRLVDLNQDTQLDIIAFSAYDSLLYYTLSEGPSSFGQLETFNTGLSGLNELAFGDLNNDGYLDIVVASWDDDEVRWFEHDGNMTFSSGNTVDSSVDMPSLISCFDVSGDGLLDLISGEFNSSNFHWKENLGGGLFSLNNEFSESTNYVRALRGEDVNLDGYADMVVLSTQDGKISWYEYLEAGQFGGQQIVSLGVEQHLDMQIGDLNGDSVNEIVTWNPYENEVFVFSYNSFSESFDSTMISVDASFTSKFMLDDLDADGDVDLVFPYQNGSIEFFKNDGTGMFTAGQILLNDFDYIFGLDIADVNSDGNNDLLVIGDTTACYLNDGDQNFSWSYSFPQLYGGGLKNISSGDFNADGLMDVLIVDNSAVKLSYHLGLGDGHFESEVVLTTNYDNLKDPVHGDFDGDGDIDIVMAVLNPVQYVLFENLENTGFAEEFILFQNPFVTKGMVASDLGADGDLDILTFQESEIRWLENLTGEGCIDPMACNFNPEAWIDNNSCCYSNCGCTVQGAENYDVNAICDDASCAFIVIGMVFYDQNENGIMDGSEYGLPFEQVLLAPDSSLLITNNDGIFYANADGSDYFAFGSLGNPLFPYFTTPEVQVFDATEDNWNDTIFFGISNELPDFGICIDFYPFGQGYPCDELSNHNICFRNMGNVPIDGLIELAYDPLFQGHQAVTPIDSAEANTVWMSFENLLPGEMFFYDLELHTPTVDYIGEFLTSTARIWGFYDADTVAFGEKTLQMEITCAYDPNDKQVFPIGYSEMHYIANDTVLEYLIRFQNTGNAPAADVRIIDTLDLNLDISSFELVANSHSVFTTIDPTTRLVDFYFQDIQLPDSVNNEPDSHGLISFRVRPVTDLPLLTELNNSASIYFDNNPPIITNTTWSTIYDCSLFEVSFTDMGPLLTASEADSYQWYIDGQAIAGANAQEYLAIEDGNYSVQVGIDFPCSAESASIFILGDALEENLSQPISFFPNPMTQRAMLDIGALRGEFLLEIFDHTGRLIRTEQRQVNSGVFTLERAGLLAGHYLLRLSNHNQSTEINFIAE